MNLLTIHLTFPLHFYVNGMEFTFGLYGQGFECVSEQLDGKIKMNWKNGDDGVR